MQLPHLEISSTQNLEFDPDWVEAMALTRLAKRTLEDQPGTLPAATGVKMGVVLAGIYLRQFPSRKGRELRRHKDVPTHSMATSH